MQAAEKQIEEEKKEESTEQEYRTLPYNIEAEQSLLGAVLTNNEAISRISDYIMPDHFYEPVHNRIYDAVLKFMDRGIIASPITLKNHFDKDEALAEVGGASYLAKLAARATGIINLETYGRIVYDLAVKRNLITIGEQVVNDAYDNNIDKTAKDQIEEAEQNLFNLASQGLDAKGFRRINSPLKEAIDSADFANKNKVSGITTGFTDIDGLLGGFQKSDLLILAARPAMGKTALAINMAVEACKKLHKDFEKNKNKEENIGLTEPSVGVFSLEMAAEQLATRMISMETGVNSSKMRLGKLREGEFEKIVEGNKKLHSLPLFIDDTPALSISAIRTRARRLKRRHNLSLLFIDYLQLIRGSRNNYDSRVQEVSEITQGLKAIAKELDIAVIALSQLSRAVEQRQDKRPQLADLRESGSIEQDADIVMFIYREEYYLNNEEPSGDDVSSPEYQQWGEQMNESQNVAEIIVSKHRNGPVGTAKIRFDSDTTKFSDLDQQYG